MVRNQLIDGIEGCHDLEPVRGRIRGEGGGVGLGAPGEEQKRQKAANEFFHEISLKNKR